MSTVEILVIPPFFAAVRMLASASKKNTFKNPLAVAVPTLEPTSLLVAFTGIVSDQLLIAIMATAPIARASVFIFFMISVKI
jgi:hypothetical protein